MLKVFFLSGVPQDANMQLSLGNIGRCIGDILAIILIDSRYFGAQGQRRGQGEGNQVREDNGQIQGIENIFSVFSPPLFLVLGRVDKISLLN